MNSSCHDHNPPNNSPSGATSSLFTCPMHSEIRQQGPGECPKCGMTLEPEALNINAVEDTSELDDMTRRFWVGLVFTLPIVITAMSDLIPGNPLASIITMQKLNWFQFVLSLPVVLWSGWPFFQRGWSSVVSRHLNMFTLIGLGTGAAFTFSIVATFLPQLFPVSMLVHGVVPVYFEAATVIIELVLLGQILELRARSRTSSAIKALLNLAPKEAKRITADGKEESVPVDQLQVLDLIRIKPGDKIPVDGIVAEGQSSVDEAMISGEPIPVVKNADDKVTAGTVNQKGSMIIQAKQVGSDTVLAQIVRMVNEAGRSKAPIQRMADQVSSYFVPAVIAIALLSALIWGFWGPEPRLAFALVNAVAVLIVACPCALGLATPVSIMVGTGKGAQNGVLIKDAASLEQLETITILVVDKTGTLTEGKPRVTQVMPASGDELSFLSLVGSLEQASEHPLAQAVVTYAHAKNVPISQPEEFNSVTGKGVHGKVTGRSVAVGSSKFLTDLQIPLPSEQEINANTMRAEGKTVFFVAIDDKFSGFIAIEDPIKHTTKSAITELQKLGLKLVMLTGDNENTAQAVARRLGIDEVVAEVMPEDKLNKVKELQSQGHKVAMAGDGINDAPALTAADVGIAMGSGTDVAMESAGITLIKGDLTGIVKAINLSCLTMKNIRQNLFFAFFYNTLGVPIAAGVLYPFVGVLLSPMIASAAMSLSSVSVIANALRLRNKNI